MSVISVHFTKPIGPVKPMHAVNNGPMKKCPDQTRDNYDAYKSAKIPYMRNHDASFYRIYGGEHSNDVHMIFPDFDADPYDPASYDFVLTDEYMERTLSAGTQIFYRLGSKIEHEIKKYGTLPPKDFKKWAVICEHIIRHMNEGWADGHHFGITYWEIWNEPDLGDKTWGGTEAQFFSLFETAAVHLKSCFPDLKIGGPALCGNREWGERFLTYLEEHKVPLDFFSWHCYSSTVDPLADQCDRVRALLDRHHYQNAESILNEYNLVFGWSDRWVESIQAIISMPGAAFTASAMLACQAKPLDMLMYYDARPCVMNGLFEYYTQQPLKGFYPFVMFSELYSLGTAVEVTSDQTDVKAAAAVGKNGKAVMLSYFKYQSDETVTFTLHLDGLNTDLLQVQTLDESRTMEASELPLRNGEVRITLKPNTVLLLKS